MSNDKLFNNELNQMGWTDEALAESGNDPLHESCINLAKAIGLDTLNMIYAEEHNDTESAEKLKELVQRYTDQLRRMVRLRLRQKEA